MKKRLLLWRSAVILLIMSMFILPVTGALAQTYTIKCTQMSVKQVLKEVTDKTGYNFVYSDELDVSKIVDIDLKECTLEELLNKFLLPRGIVYKVEGKQILLTLQSKVVQVRDSDRRMKQSDTKKVCGVVVDKAGLPLPGVSIQNLTNKKGTYSELSGDFIIDANEGDKILFSFIGFKSRQILMTASMIKQKKMSIEMEEDAIALESVAVIGYGNTQKIKDVTGSIAHIGKKELESAPMGSTVQSLLQGRASGVNVQIQSASPTSPVSVIIRGQSSLSGDNQPLWVIDGIPEANTGVSGSISNVLYSLNLNDVESIDILKDASSTAIYGSRAANGVIVVTTKSGKEGMKPTLELLTRWGFQSIDFNGYDYFTAEEYKNFTRAATRKELGRYGYFNYFTRQYLDEKSFWKQKTSEMDLSKIKDLPNAYYDSDTYWIGEMTQIPINQQYDLTLRGGIKEVSYSASINYNDMQGIVKTGFSRSVGGRMRIQAKVSNSLKLRLSANGTTRNTSDKDGMLSIIKKVRPDIPPYNPDGTIFTRDAYTENPYTTLANKKFGTGESFAASGELEWTILDGLMYTSRVSVSYSNGETLEYLRRGSTFNTEGKRNWSRSKDDTKIWDNTLVFAKTLGLHDISLSLTNSLESSQSIYYNMSASNFPDDDVLNSFSDAATMGSMGESYNSHSLISQIGRIQYKLKDKYLATSTIRHDGSSKFGTDRRWGWFPSIGLGWIISNEDFMKGGWLGDNLTHAKIRTSFGKSGSQNLGSYQWMSMVGSVNYNESPGIYPSNIGNMNLQWEESMMADVALELEFFKSRLRGTLGYFSRDSKNLIYSQSLAPSSAFSNMSSNIASTKTFGYEFSIEGDLIKNSKCQLTLNLNGAHNVSKIINFNNTLKELNPSYSKIVAGGPIGNWFGHVTYKRLFGSSEEVIALRQRDEKGAIKNYRNSLEGDGDIYVKDLNGDGKIDNDDKSVLGSSIPKLYGGFGLQLYIGTSINIGANFTYSYGNKRLWYMAMTDVGNTGNYNQSNKVAGMSAVLLSPYLPGVMPNATPYGVGANNLFCDYWLYDASYIRLNSLNVSYRMGKHHFGKSMVDNIEFTIQATNLFTLTKYPGFDPQGNFSTGTQMTYTQGVDYSFYPSGKTFNLGIKFTFR